MTEPTQSPSRSAPDWLVERWYQTDDAPSLAALRGRVVVLEVFQMLCPACVSHGLPQARRVREAFDPNEVAVLGLHSVFEHHRAMGHESLEAFLHEYRLPFPVGVDAPGDGRIPRTMEAYRLRGTPTLLLFDRSGKLRAEHFGQVSDLRLGAEIVELVLGPSP